ncbi:hypothetical protein [Rhodobacter xanthinilyticus]|uniref:hypothetical protein n=1 Tax=Rhodobacter xanthinilyticus TaxID=1850250 RepID=UPI0012EB5A63|nr:hypothetical protein [Rhodobacter xanthinilyticus]
MTEQRREALLPLERWKAAKVEAEKASPSPKTSAAIAGFGGLFGGFTATYFFLGMSELVGLAGLDADNPTFEGPAILAGLACGVVGYLYIRSKEKAHYAAFTRALEAEEGRWRRERERSA